MAHILKQGTSILKVGGNIFRATDMPIYSGYSFNAPTSPKDVIIDNDKNRCYIPNSNNTVLVVDLTNFNIIASIPGFNNPQAGCLDVSNNCFYMTNYGGSTIMKINRDTFATSSLTISTNPLSCTLNPVNNKIYVVHEATSVTMIDTATFSISGSFTLTGTVQPRGSSIDPITNRLFTAQGGSIITVNLNTNTIINANAATISNSRNLTVDVARNRLWAGEQGTNNLCLFDLTTVGLIQKIPGFSGIYGLQYDPTTLKLYIACSSANSISVINTTLLG